MSIKGQWRKWAIVAAFALTGATQVSAQSMAAVTNGANFTWAGVAPVVVPGMFTPLFAHPGGRFIATFAAECAVNAAAGSTAAWVDVDVFVTNAFGTPVAFLPPTVGAADAFCSSNGTPGFDGWASQSVTAVAVLPAGNYRVRVRARLNNGATGGWLGERSLVVSR